jgi:hypothetical protein
MSVLLPEVRQVAQQQQVSWQAGEQMLLEHFGRLPGPDDDADRMTTDQLKLK